MKVAGRCRLGNSGAILLEVLSAETGAHSTRQTPGQSSGSIGFGKDLGMESPRQVLLLSISLLWVTRVNSAPHLIKPFFYRYGGIRPAYMMPQAQQFQVQEQSPPVTKTIYVILQEDDSDSSPIRNVYQQPFDGHRPYLYKGPYVPEQQPQRHYVAVQPPQRPYVAEQQTQRPYVAEQQPQRPYVAEQQTQLPYVAEQQPQRPYVAEQQPQRPYVAEQQPQRPYVAEQQTQRPYVAEQPQRPYSSPALTIPAEEEAELQDSQAAQSSEEDEPSQSTEDTADDQPSNDKGRRPYHPPADVDAQLQYDEDNPPIDIRSSFSALPRENPKQ